MALLETRALEIGYKKDGEVRMLANEVELKLAPGEVVCLLGQNGVGKSTLLKTISGLIPSLGGEVAINQKPWLNIQPAAGQGTKPCSQQ